MKKNEPTTCWSQVIAIDPGTDASGIAIFDNGILKELRMMSLPELTDFIASADAHFVIEDVEAIKTIYNRNRRSNQRKGLQVAQSVGLVKATGRHIIAFMNWHSRTYTLIPPTAGNWGTMATERGKQALKACTGWIASSNKDTRSAAFFGHYYLRSEKQKARCAKAVL